MRTPILLVGFLLLSCAPPTQSTVGVTVKGTVSDAAWKTRIGDVEVCVVEPADTVPCVRTNFNGEFALIDVPKNSRVLLRFLKNGYYPNLAHYTTAEEEETLTYLLTNDEVNDLAYGIANVTRDDSKGVIIFACRTGKGPDATNVPGVTMTLSPASGEGPFYASSDGVLDKDRTETTDVGGGTIFNVEPGDYTFQYSHPSKKCRAYYGWQTEGAENTLDVRVQAGFTTYVNQICVD